MWNCFYNIRLGDSVFSLIFQLLISEHSFVRRILLTSFLFLASSQGLPGPPGPPGEGGKPGDQVSALFCEI